MRVPFLGGSGGSQSIRGQERCVNFYPEPQPDGRVFLLPTPGYTLWATLPQDYGRGCADVDGRLFVVAGTGLYEVDATAMPTLRGTVADDAVHSPATFSKNNQTNELFITAGGNGYILNLTTNVLTQVLTGDADFGGFVDGYFLALDATTSILRISNDNNGLVWDPLDFAPRATASDPWVAMTILDREVRLLGTFTSDVYYNSGDPDFPFKPVATIHFGVNDPYSSVALADKSIVWLSANERGFGTVMRASGYDAQRVSTFTVEHAIQGYTQFRDAVAWAYQDRGHTFYVLNFPTMNATWVLDLTTGLWHERGGWDAANMTYTALRAQHHASIFGHHLVMDRLGSGIYIQSINAYKGIGDTPIRRLRQGPHLSNEQRAEFASSAQLDMDVGLGTVATSDPQVMMQWSRNGGVTWSDERWASAGATGKYQTRVRWRQLGSARDRVFRVVMSDPVPWRLTDFFFDGVVGTS